MAKTYVSKLRKVAADFQRYATRWQVKLNENLTTEQKADKDAAVEKVQALMDSLGPEPFNP